MPQTEFGALKLSYAVRPDGSDGIEVQVAHNNREVRRTLLRYQQEPSGLLRFETSYANSPTRAKFYLSEVMAAYRPYFVRNRVKFRF